jgi:hypothetical protein
MKIRINALCGTVAFWALFLWAGRGLAFNYELSPLEESSAYRQFSRRPSSELTKLLYLIDRFKDTQVIVVYDGANYEAREAARIAKKFLMSNYKKETAEFWVRKYCFRSESANRWILFKAPDGSAGKAGEILLAELELLHRFTKEGGRPGDKSS